MSINIESSFFSFKKMVDVRRTIHKNPELSFQEFETSKYVQEFLQNAGIEFRVVAGTGVVAHVGSGTRCVALRADIDALPIEEETGLEYASRNAGVMHACGHDMHTTMLLSAARILKSRESELQGVVKLLFQPGEEKSPGGASLMIAEGALQNPTPSMIFGQHMNPEAPCGQVSFVSGPMMAAADELYITIRGFGAHAAQPHKGHDPIITASVLIQHLQTLITKSRNPLVPGVLTITSIHGGSATNIIPEVVELKGTLRAFDQEWREHAWEFITTSTKTICQLHHCEGEVEIMKGYPPLVNHEAATEFARKTAIGLLGPSNVTDFEPKMWAEDFSFYSQYMPACFWMLGGRPPNVDAMPGLHNAKFAPDEQSMIAGSALMVEVAIRALEIQ